MANTDFSMWNPALANMESDSTYQSDSSRTGGAVSGPFDSNLANKLFYQLGLWLRASALMMVSKGYSPVDGTTPFQADSSSNAEATALAAILNHLITDADLQNSGSPYAGMLVATPSATDNSHAVADTAFAQQFTVGGTPKQRVQSGQIGAGGTTAVTFPVAFGSGTPIVVAIPIGNGTANLTATPTVTGFSINSSDGSPLNWIAIGNA